MRGDYVLVTILSGPTGPVVHTFGPMTRAAARKAQQAYLSHPSARAQGELVRTAVCHLQAVTPW